MTLGQLERRSSVLGQPPRFPEGFALGPWSYITYVCPKGTKWSWSDATLYTAALAGSKGKNRVI